MIVVTSFLSANAAVADEGVGEFGAYTASKSWTPPTDPAVLRKLQEWQGLKFGVLLDWQACTQWGIDSWPLCPERYEWNVRKDWVRGTPEGAEQDHAKYKANYEALQKTFRPTRFDPRQWADMLSRAGVKYALIMAKHHDGFCLWDTKQTDYKTTSKDCPFHALPGADTVKSIGDALRKHGIRVGIYFSKPDWNTPYFWDPALPFAKNRNANYSPLARPETWRKFKQFTWAQIEELMSNYGPIDILWLDGGWVQPRSNAQDIDMDGIAAMARRYQPGLLVVDRTVKGPNENYITPEGVHAMPQAHRPYPWEACMPISGHWNYFPNDTYKSAGTLVRYLCQCAGRGGNYLLGIGPDASGAFEPAVIERMAAVGAWLKVNGEAIYDTRPIKPYEQAGCVFTARRDGTVYAILLAKNDAEKLPTTVALPAELVARAKSVSLLGFGAVEIGATRDGATTLAIPAAALATPPCEHAWVFKLARLQD
jgi:alpha-L-fucosidase